jgi:hypothetical protein
LYLFGISDAYIILCNVKIVVMGWISPERKRNAVDDNDPLAPFRRTRQSVTPDQAQETLTERQALKLAIEALNGIPNSRIRTQNYTKTYDLIPDLEKAYRAGAGRAVLENLAPRMYQTLLLCEDVLSELGRLDDGTPSISALTDIRTIKEEAGYPSEAQVIGRLVPAPAQSGTEAKSEATAELLARAPDLLEENDQLKAINAELHGALMEASNALTQLDPLAEQHDAKIIDDALAKVRTGQQPTREPSVPGPDRDRDIDLEPDL